MPEPTPAPGELAEAKRWLLGVSARGWHNHDRAMARIVRAELDRREIECDARRDEVRHLLAEIERLRRELCKALAIPPDTPWDEVIADAHSAGVVRDAEYRALDGCRTEVERLRAQRQAVLDLHPRLLIGAEGTWPVCGTCREPDEEPTPWPCPTAEALGEAE